MTNKAVKLLIVDDDEDDLYLVKYRKRNTFETIRYCLGEFFQ